MIDLSIIIISYNTREFLKKCVESIRESFEKKISYEIIIVDNNSDDGTIDEIKNRDPELKIIQNKQNLGFSKANNIGIKNSKGKYILFLNPDTVIHPGTLEKMIEFMDSDKKAGAATCLIKLPSGKLDDASHRGFPTPWNAFSYFSGLAKIFPRSKFFSGYSLGWMNLKQAHEIDACAGAFMIVRREAGDQINWWDEDYFWYGEDLDFCFRLKEKGWKIYFVPDSSILHYKGVSGGIKKDSENISTASEETKKMAQRARFDAMRIFYKKHYQNYYPGLVNWMVLKGVDIRQKFS